MLSQTDVNKYHEKILLTVACNFVKINLEDNLAVVYIKLRMKETGDKHLMRHIIRHGVSWNTISEFLHVDRVGRAIFRLDL